MGVEIERKFLVKGTDWKTQGKRQFYQQGYVSTNPERSVRIRRVEDKGYITLKGKTTNASRSEYEYPIPVDDAVAMLRDLCEKPLIEKYRYKIQYEGLTWEVDEFQGDNQGLVVAEVELDAADQEISLPDWVDQEVTHDERYFNLNLSKHPFSTWASSGE